MPRVWLVEDNAAFRHTTERVLQCRTDFTGVRVFIRCEDALAAMQAGPPPDVILLDVGLPGIDGIQGIREIKRLAPTVSVLMLTVFENQDKIFRAVCAGASGYLLKSAPIQGVLDAVDQVLAGGSPMNPKVARRVLELITQQNLGSDDYDLTERERYVLELLVRGFMRKQIADEAGMNPHTLKYVLRCIYRKLGVTRVSEAVSLALQKRLVSTFALSLDPKR